MTDTAGSAAQSLPPAVQRMIEATNAEDSEAFLSVFGPQSVIDDWGRQFVGLDRIAHWNAHENIGTHSRIEVLAAHPTTAGVDLDIRVSGGGYNGGGTFSITTARDIIQTLTIRG